MMCLFSCKPSLNRSVQQELATLYRRVLMEYTLQKKINGSIKSHILYDWIQNFAQNKGAKFESPVVSQDSVYGLRIPASAPYSIWLFCGDDAWSLDLDQGISFWACAETWQWWLQRLDLGHLIFPHQEDWAYCTSIWSNHGSEDLRATWSAFSYCWLAQWGPSTDIPSLTYQWTGILEDLPGSRWWQNLQVLEKWSKQKTPMALCQFWWKMGQLEVALSCENRPRLWTMCLQTILRICLTVLAEIFKPEGYWRSFGCVSTPLCKKGQIAVQPGCWPPTPLLVMLDWDA